MYRDEKPQLSKDAAGSPQVRERSCSSAEDYHQQYLYKVPHGYCPDHSTTAPA
jgi:peptide methionine sulfoxide reductase MsrA